MDESRNGEAEAAMAEDEAPQAMALREEAAGGRSGSSFDPTPYLRQLRGRGGGTDYLDVKWRLLWLRREHPDAEIVTEHVQIDPTIAIFKATVALPTGGKATGYGSETAGDFGDFIEKAETKAIGRALNALGYGAQFTEAGDEVEAAEASRPTPAARDTRPSSRSAAPDAATAAPRPEGRFPWPETPDPEPRPKRPAPIDITAGRERPDRATPASATGPAPAAGSGPRASAGAEPAADPSPRDADPDLTEYSWSAFWPWARGLGIADRRAVETLIGRSTASLTPAQLRDLILAARGEG